MRNVISVTSQFRKKNIDKCPPTVILTGTRNDGTHRYQPIRPTPSSVKRIKRLIESGKYTVFYGDNHTNIIGNPRP